MPDYTGTESQRHHVLWSNESKLDMYRGQERGSTASMKHTEEDMSGTSLCLGKLFIRKMFHRW